MTPTRDGASPLTPADATPAPSEAAMAMGAIQRCVIRISVVRMTASRQVRKRTGLEQARSAPLRTCAAMAVTSRDVAQRAGVSQSTVSLVLSGKATGRVGRQTVELVQRAAQELGYR